MKKYIHKNINNNFEYYSKQSKYLISNILKSILIILGLI